MSWSRLYRKRAYTNEKSVLTFTKTQILRNIWKYFVISLLFIMRLVPCHTSTIFCQWATSFPGHFALLINLIARSLIRAQGPRDPVYEDAKWDYVNKKCFSIGTWEHITFNEQANPVPGSKRKWKWFQFLLRIGTNVAINESDLRKKFARPIRFEKIVCTSPFYVLI